MTALKRTPQNTGFLQPTKYQLVFPNIENMVFFCQSINIPGLSINSLPQPTPFVDIVRPGQKISYETLEIEFIVDEYMNSWKDIHNWIRSMADPVTFPVLNKAGTTYSDAILTVLTNLNNPNIRIHFKNMFPSDLSGIKLSTTDSADTTITATATFRYDYYDIETPN
jgi:hypothetical protein